MVTRRPHRTPAQTLEHLEQQRRLAAADIDHGQIRVAALDRAIDALRNGRRIEPCALELARETDHDLKDATT